MIKFALILNILLIAGTANLAYAQQDQIAGSKLTYKDKPLTGDLVRDGVAVFAPELNQILALQREGRATVEITPLSFTYKCIDTVYPCVIR